VYRGSVRGCNPLIAMACDVTIAEVDEIVEVGELDPEVIVTPEVFVHRIVKVPEGGCGSQSYMEALFHKALRASNEAEQEQPQYQLAKAKAVGETVTPPIRSKKGETVMGGKMKERLSEETIALRVVKELKDGDYVNLGAGMPLLCAQFIPENKEIFYQAEQGVVGYTKTLLEEEWEIADLDYVTAGGEFIHPFIPGLSFFDIGTSFDMIIGKHLDCTVLGGLEVSERGDLANWSWGPVETGGIGGSMDLAVGAKKVIIAMTHTDKKGNPKVVNECKLPLTAKECVDLIVTDLAVIEVTPQGLLLKEVAPGWTAEEVQALTQPKLIIADDLTEMTL